MSKIKLKRGDDEDYLLTIIEATDQGSQPLDLTHVERIDLHAKDDGERVLTLSTTDGSIERLNDASGEILLYFRHELTEKARWFSADYDVQLTFKNGRRKTVLSGRIELSHDVTRLSKD